MTRPFGIDPKTGHIVMEDEDWVKFGSKMWTKYLGAIHVMDADCPNTYAIGLTSKTWIAGIDKNGISATDYKELENFNSLWRTKQRSSAAVACENPGLNFISSGHTYS